LIHDCQLQESIKQNSSGVLAKVALLGRSSYCSEDGQTAREAIAQLFYAFCNNQKHIKSDDVVRIVIQVYGSLLYPIPANEVIKMVNLEAKCDFQIVQVAQKSLAASGSAAIAVAPKAGVAGMF
jgi:hypothetical protein